MKKTRLIFWCGIVATFAVAITAISNSRTQRSLSTLNMLNVEALTQGEIPQVDCLHAQGSTCYGTVETVNGSIYGAAYPDMRNP